MKFNVYLWIGLSALLLLFSLYGLFQLSKARTFQFFGGLTHRVETSEKVVALTFDDAPTSQTDDVLKILADRGVQATFYLIGQNIEQIPEIAKRIVAAGHEVGNHSYSHQRMIFNHESPSFVRTEIETTNWLIRETGYQGEITFRPPNGKKLFVLPWFLNQQQIQTIMWDVEPDTYAMGMEEGDAKTQFLVNHTLERVKPGSIILLHQLCASCKSDRQALGLIIDRLQAQGYQFITISELLAF